MLQGQFLRLQHIGNVVEEVVEEFVRVLLHEIVEGVVLLTQPGDKLFRCDRTEFLLLANDVKVQIRQTAQEIFFGPFVGQTVLEHFFAKRPAEVERLQD